MSTKQKWTREVVIAAIQLWAERHGRPPLSSEWLQPQSVRGSEYPSLSAVYRTKNKQYAPFATWSEAVEAAGFPRPKGTRGKKRARKQREEWTAERVIRELREKSNWGRAPSSKNEIGLRKAANRFFGSWDEACAAAGLIPKGKKLY